MSRRRRHVAALLLLAAYLARCFAFGPAPPQADAAQADGALATLLGPERWQFNDWRAETDDVRGGSSIAYFRGDMA